MTMTRFKTLTAFGAAACLVAGLATASHAAIIGDYDFTDSSDSFTRESEDAGTWWNTSEVTDNMNGGVSMANKRLDDWGRGGEPDLAWQTDNAEVTDSNNLDDSTTYLEFTVTPDPQFVELDLTGISAWVLDEKNSTFEWGFKSSMDGFTDWLVEADGVQSSYAEVSADLNGGDFSGISDPVTFRLYAVDGAPTNQGGVVRVDDILLEGTFTIPEPASVALIGLGGAILLSRRRRRHA